jgi:nitroreductase
VIIVVCVDKKKSHNREIENGILATANIMLGAQSRGLGSVFLSAYRAQEPRTSEEIKRLLAIPESIDPITIIPLGYPDEIPEAKDLRPLGRITHHEKF